MATTDWVSGASGDPLTSAYHYKLLISDGSEEAGIPYRRIMFSKVSGHSRSQLRSPENHGTPRRNTPYGGNVCLDIIAAGAYQYFYENRIRTR